MEDGVLRLAVRDHQGTLWLLAFSVRKISLYLTVHLKVQIMLPQSNVPQVQEAFGANPFCSLNVVLLYVMWGQQYNCRPRA